MIKVISPGISTTIQDAGRFGFAHFGVPTSGAMDLRSCQLANAILNNKLNAAVLEITYGNAKFEFLADHEICISGANFTPQINDKEITVNKRIFVSKGDQLTFGNRIYGLRVYLAVKGGIRSEVKLNSRSMYKGITEESILSKEEIISTSTINQKPENTYAKFKIDEGHFTSSIIECFRGPEFNLLTKEQQEKLNTITFSISPKNSRMGYMLTEKVENNLPSILSSGVLPGTVQLTPSGELIILMRDCQVTGGYPRVLQLTEEAINRLAQKITGEKINFTL
ncbi:biotin-dependent carboxyltransferase family protein [Tenacibaculum sp. 190524A05c]|uniref:5-oxoprolinase subunit C family protein n=1 Tax=Tenacibaculum platacis TaxID=3137852 RepID=UPI0031FB6B8E